MRAGIKKLLADQEEKKAEIDRLRGLLATLSKENDDNNEETNNNNNNIFAMTLAEKCAEIVRRMFEESDKKAGYGWILGRKLATKDSLETETLIDELQTVISTEIHTVVGDAAYTAEELKERRVAALKGEDVTNRRSAAAGMMRDNAQQLGGLLEIFAMEKMLVQKRVMLPILLRRAKLEEHGMQSKDIKSLLCNYIFNE